MNKKATKKRAGKGANKQAEEKQEPAPKVSRAAQWRAHAEEKQRKPDESETAEVDFGDGFICVVRRLPLHGWLRSGRVPDYLAREVFVEGASSVTPQTLDSETAQREYDELTAFERFAVPYVTVSPHVVLESEITPERPLGDDEVTYEEIAIKTPRVLQRIIGWILADSPEIPVRTTDGEAVTVSDLASFRESQQVGESSSSGSGSPPVFWQTTPTPRNL